jgi:serine/threonine protein kinase
MLRDMHLIEPVIVDFGLAVYEDDEDYHYYQCGTPGYISP